MNEIKNYSEAIGLIKSAILKSRYRAAALANRELLSLYYGIGRFISENSRGGFWGTGAIDAISENLQQEMPGLRGFSPMNIKRMRLFYEAWKTTLPIRPLPAVELLTTDNESNTNRTLAAYDLETKILEEDTIRPLPTVELETTDNESVINRPLATVEIRPLPTDELSVLHQNIDIESLISIRQPATGELTMEQMKMFLSIGFTHHCEIIAKERAFEERIFYIERCATEFWSVENLKYHLKSDLYGKRGTMPNNFKTTITDKEFQRKALLSFKDEYLIDFINIEAPDDEPDERVFESEIVSNIRKFIMTLGKEFSFIGNQYRMMVDEKEYFVDLLFFNRQLQCLVAFDLKRGEFKPEYLGKMNFYLSALDDLVRLPHENHSIGIILCKSQKQKTVEYALRDMSKPMGVASYRTAAELPDKYKDVLPDAEKLIELM